MPPSTANLTRSPNSYKVQSRLGDVMRILTEATELLDGDIGKAVIWFGINRSPASRGRLPMNW